MSTIHVEHHEIGSLRIFFAVSEKRPRKKGLRNFLRGRRPMYQELIDEAKKLHLLQGTAHNTLWLQRKGRGPGGDVGDSKPPHDNVRRVDRPEGIPRAVLPRPFGVPKWEAYVLRAHRHMAHSRDLSGQR